MWAVVFTRGPENGSVDRDVDRPHPQSQHLTRVKSRKGKPQRDTKLETSPGKILEKTSIPAIHLWAHSKNFAPGRSISLFKFIKGKLPGSRIAVFPYFRLFRKHANCRNCLRIAGNCLRVAIRIAEWPSELPAKLGTQTQSDHTLNHPSIHSSIHCDRLLGVQLN